MAKKVRPEFPAAAFSVQVNDDFKEPAVLVTSNVSREMQKKDCKNRINLVVVPLLSVGELVGGERLAVRSI